MINSNIYFFLFLGILRSPYGPDDFENLVNRDLLRQWIDSCDNGPGTIKTNLTSVKQFYSFCVDRRSDILDIEKIPLMEKSILHWQRNLWKQIKRDSI